MVLWIIAGREFFGVSPSCCLTITTEVIWDGQIWFLFYARCQAACKQELVALAPHIEILKLTISMRCRAFAGYHSYIQFLQKPLFGRSQSYDSELQRQRCKNLQRNK
jgi:hypothetical protein